MATRGSPAVAFARRASARRASGGASPLPRVPSSRLARVSARADASGGSTTAPSSEISRERLVEESLEACGWSELREHLAEYASTRLGQEACRDLPLPLGGPWESERLLDETEAAMAMESFYGTSLDFGGIMSAEVRRALYKAEKYASLGGDEFAAMAAFIASSTRLVKTIEGVRENGAPPAALAPLRSVVAAVAPRPEVADKIRACVDDQGGFRDNASPELRRARSQRSAAEAKLRRALQSGNGSVTTHQGRMVLAVTPPAPPGSLVVGVAAGGALVLVEPPSVVVLNGQLAQTIAAEETAIDAIRRKLTYDVAEAATDLFAALETVVRLDVVAARGRHAAALNACRPRFVAPPGQSLDRGFGAYPAREEGEGDGEDGAWNAADRARNAEMAASFPTLDRGGALDADPDAELESFAGEEENRPGDGQKELLVELAGLRQPVLAAQAIRARKALRRAAAKAAAAKRTAGGDDARGAEDDLLLGPRSSRGSDSGFGDASSSAPGPVVRGPVPVDVFVPLSARSVVITGPNTGGKTAAMKAVGLSALMARAGLFVPAETALLPWFDDVLVDIGDAQDLMLSLSTFSARLAKQRAILDAATPGALVLMDEVGTGTSPAEGSAIGAALLERLAGVGPGADARRAAGLTLATTHHGELKALKYEHPGGVFENAAVEFDEAALAPTYRLLWGVPGRSRALQIAERFGMDEAVTRDARRALGEGRVTLETTISALETARRGADENISSARALLQEVRRTVPKIRRAAARVEAAEEKSDAEVAAGVAKLARLRRATLAGRAGDAARAAARSRRESTLANGAADFASAAAKAAAAAREAKRLDALAAKAPKPAVPPGWAPEAGERVVVKSTGMRGEVASTTGGKLVVRAGAMQIKVSAADVEPDSEAEAPARPSAKARSPRGTRAAARVDALLGATRAGGARGGAGNAPPPPPSDAFGFGLGLDDAEDAPTIGDSVRIRKTGVVGTVVDACDGVLTVQAGRNQLKSPVEGVELHRGAGGGGGAGGGAGGGGKKKQKKKKGGGLPRATQTQRGGGGRNAGPSDASGGSDVNDLMAKFNRR